MSVSMPALWALIAARSSGALAIRSINICTSSLSRTSAQACSAASESSACLTTWASSSLLRPAASVWLAIARSIARPIAGLRRARRIASSTASSTARSMPVT